MTDSAHAMRHQLPGSGERRPPAAVWAFVLAVVAAGVVVLASALTTLRGATFNLYIVILAALTIVSGRFKIKMPGHPATVSVSEIFVFTSLLLFGPAPASMIVALDGLWASATQTNRRLHRTLFNIAEPALSTWMAGSVFFAAAGRPALGLWNQEPGGLLLPALAMAATYFLFNSVLTALAIGLEAGVSALGVWKRHALYLGLNYYAAASLAALAANSPTGLNLEVVGLVVPLLLLSYAAYKTAASRVEDAQRHVTEVEHLYKSTVETLAVAVDAKDLVTHGHIRRVQRHCLALARAMGMADDIELKAIQAGSLLHDIGKLAIPDYVLNKPGGLSRAEYEIMKQHAAIGATILGAVEFPYPVVPMVRHHHEFWNGNGYPDGLAGRDIPLGARILTIVDCFDAVTSDRPYRRRMSDEEAIEILRERRGVMYDPELVDAFIAMIPELRREDARLEADLRAHHSTMAAAVHVERMLPLAGRGTSAEVERLRAIGPARVAPIERLMPGAELCLFAHDRDTDALVPVYTTEGIRETLMSQQLYVGDSLSGWVASNRHTIVNSDPRLDLGETAPWLGLQACTSTPVFSLGTLVGVLSVYTPAAGRFSEKEAHLLGAIAQEIAIEFGRREQASAGAPAEKVDTPTPHASKPLAVA